VERAAVQAMGTSAGSQGAQGAPGSADSARPALQRTSSGTLQLDKDVFWFAAQVCLVCNQTLLFHLRAALFASMPMCMP
jgi:hypothetical protein